MKDKKVKRISEKDKKWESLKKAYAALERRCIYLSKKLDKIEKIILGR